MPATGSAAPAPTPRGAATARTAAGLESGCRAGPCAPQGSDVARAESCRRRRAHRCRGRAPTPTPNGSTSTSRGSRRVRATTPKPWRLTAKSYARNETAAGRRWFRTGLIGPVQHLLTRRAGRQFTRGRRERSPTTVSQHLLTRGSVIRKGEGHPVTQRAGPTEAATGTGGILPLERRIPVPAYNQLHGSIVARFGVAGQAQGPDCRAAPPKPSHLPPADEAAGPTPAARPSCRMVPDRAHRIGDRHGRARAAVAEGLRRVTAAGRPSRSRCPRHRRTTGPGQRAASGRADGTGP